jgi:hypothetical protein
MLAPLSFTDMGAFEAELSTVRLFSKQEAVESLHK